jgi:hypothetical protein
MITPKKSSRNFLGKCILHAASSTCHDFLERVWFAYLYRGRSVHFWDEPSYIETTRLSACTRVVFGCSRNRAWLFGGFVRFVACMHLLSHWHASSACYLPSRAWSHGNEHFGRTSSAWLTRESCIAWDQVPTSNQGTEHSAAASVEPGFGVCR